MKALIKTAGGDDFHCKNILQLIEAEGQALCGLSVPTDTYHKLVIELCK